MRQGQGPHPVDAPLPADLHHHRRHLLPCSNWLLSLLANRVDRALQAGSLGAAARGARRGGTAGAGDGAGTVGAMA